jgi:ribosome maturation factor RimP
VGASPLFCWARERRQRRTACGSRLELPAESYWNLRSGSLVGSLGLEIFDVEWKIGKQRLLRVYIDRLPGPQNPEGLGVTHKDCERVSEQLSVIIDVEDLVPGPAYVLEVSSPGLDRKLMKAADYERFVGRLARIWVTEAIENQNYFEGRLAGFADGVVKLNVKGREMAVPFAGIKKANLVVEL